MSDTGDRNVKVESQFFNKVVIFLAGRGISLFGSRLLSVRGRTSGQWRSTPVNPLTYEGRRYLLSPRGQTQWVRNIRVSGGGRLRIGKNVEEFTVTELSDAEKPDVLRHYLDRWGWEVGRYFEEDIKPMDDDKLARLARTVPIFLLTRQS